MRVIQNTTPAPKVRFATPHRTGGFDFSTHSGCVQTTIFTTSLNPGDLAPLDQASVTTTPDEAIGHAWITWAQHARNQNKQHGQHSHAHSQQTGRDRHGVGALPSPVAVRRLCGHGPQAPFEGV